MKLEIEILDEHIEAMAKSAIGKAFIYNPGSDYGAGTLAVQLMDIARHEAKEQIARLDLADMIRPLVAQYAPGIVQDIVKQQLRDMAKRVVKDMKDKGELA